MLQDAWENADKAFVPRVKHSKNADGFVMLPQEFKNADVQKYLDLNSNSAHTQIDRWEKAGFIERVMVNGEFKQVYRKVVDFII